MFVNGIEIYKFKAKDSEIVATLLCLQNISKDWPVDNMKETGLNWYVYEFNVDYSPIIKSTADATITIPALHKYLMVKYNIKQNVSVHQKMSLRRINIVLKFNKRKFMKMGLNGQSEVSSKTTNYVKN